VVEETPVNDDIVLHLVPRRSQRADLDQGAMAAEGAAERIRVSLSVVGSVTRTTRAALQERVHQRKAESTTKITGLVEAEKEVGMLVGMKESAQG
jgi:hypothetical protein